MKNLEKKIIFIFFSLLILSSIFLVARAGSITLTTTPRCTSNQAYIDLSWTTVAGGPTYYIWRKTENDSFVQISSTLLVSYSDPVDSDKNYTYKITTSGDSSEEIFVGATYCPPILSVSSGCTGSQALVNLNWTSADFPTFLILKKIQGQADFVQIAEVSSGRNYQDTNVDSDKKYVYQIKAQSGTNYYYSKEASSSAAYCPAFLLPPAASCQSDGPRINLSWNYVSGSLSTYEIYRDGANIGQTTSANHVDGPNIEGTKNYSYFIRTKWQDGTARDSEIASVRAEACPPTLSLASECLAVSPGGPRNNLSWNSLLGIQEYQIFRKAQAEAEFSYLKTVSQISCSDDLVESLASYSQGGTASYYVKAIWPDATWKNSQSVQAEISQCPPFLKIESVCAGETESLPEMHLFWTATKGAELYNIWRDGSYLNQTASLGYIDNLSLIDCPGTICEHDYKVEANITGLPNSSEAKSIDCSTPTPPAPAPVLIASSTICVDGDSRISVSWSPSNNITYYTLYRQGAIVTTQNLTTTSYVDSGVDPGYEYKYWVKAYGKGGQSVDSLNDLTITAISCDAPTASNVTLAKGCEIGKPYVNISWTETTNTYSYEVWRGPSATSLSILMSFDQGSPEFNSRIFKDNSVSPSTAYYYKIVSKGPPGGASTNSNIPSVATNSCLPSTPILSSSAICENGAAAVSLSWTTDTANTLRYDIYRNDYSTTSPIKIIYDISTKTWKDTSVSQQNSYRYTIEAIGFGDAPAKATSSSNVITNNCQAPGSFILSTSTLYCALSYPMSYFSWTPSANALSYDFNSNRLNPDDSIAETIIYYNTASPYVNKGFGSALRFDGSNDYVSIPSSPSLQITGNLTLSFWAFPTNVSATNPRQNPIGKAYGGEFDLTMEPTGRLSYYHGSAGGNGSPYMSCSSAGIFSANTWVNVTIVRDVSARTVKVYKNGVLQTTCTSGWVNPSASTRTLKIGYEYAGYFKGTIDQVRIYNRILDSTEINALYGGNYYNDSGLVGYWGFEEGSGLVASDGSNKGNSATLASSPYAPVWVNNGIQSGSRYNWQAKAINFGGSTYSNISGPDSIPICPPAKPGLVIAPLCQGVTSTANISFSYAMNAVSYEIYRQDKGLIETIVQSISPSSRTFIDSDVTASTSYTYYVKAIGSTGFITESDHLSVTATDCLKPAQPQNLTVTFSCSGSYPRNNLRWDISNNATSYTIYRASSSSPFPVSIATTTYADTAVNVNTTYSYYVIAYGPAGSSIPSNSIASSIGYCPPSTPSITLVNTNCENFASKNTISWSDSTTFNTTSYEIYRNTSNATTAEPIEVIESTDPEFSSRIWEDSSAILPNTTYYYWVKASGPAGESAYSASKSVSTYSCGITPDAPSLNQESLVCKNNIPYATLSWNSVPNAYSYNLYRSNEGISTSTYSTRVSPFYDQGAASLRFDGINDYAKLSQRLTLTNYSFEMWVRPGAPKSTWRSLIADSGSGWELDLYPGTNRIDAYSNGGLLSSFSLVTDTWYHIVLTRDSSGTKLYRDGVLDVSNASVTTINNIALQLGKWYTSQYYIGNLDDVRIYGRALSAAEVAEHYFGLYRNETDLKAVFHLDDATGTTAYDNSGNNNNITLTGPVWQTESPGGTQVFPLDNKKEYKYTVRAVGYESFSQSSNVVSINKNCLPLEQSLTAAPLCNQLDSQIKLSWGSDVNTDYWTVYRKRKTEDFSFYRPVATYINDTYYVDDECESGVDYNYYISAVGSGGASTPSNQVEQQAPLCNNPPLKPVIIAAPQCSGYSAIISIEWDSDPSENTFSYNIYRQEILESGPTEFAKIEEGIGKEVTQYSDMVEEKKKYAYKIEAVGSGEGNTVFSDPSSVITSYECTKITPFPPIISENYLVYVEAKNDGVMAQVSIGWTDAGNEEEYQVFRRYGDASSFSRQNNKWEKIITKIFGKTIYAAYENPLIVLASNTTNYLDYTVSENTYYDYQVMASNTNGVAFSNVLENVYIPIAKPGNFTLSGEWVLGNKIRLFWSPAPTSPAGGTVSYTVLRSSTRDFSSAKEICANITDIECIDNSPSLLESYYIVRAANNAADPTYSNDWRSRFSLPVWRESAPK